MTEGSFRPFEIAGVEKARRMAELGACAIEVTGAFNRDFGQVMLAKRGARENVYYRDRAIAVKRVVSIPVMMVGAIRNIETARSIVDRGDADLISMCRPFVRSGAGPDRTVAARRYQLCDVHLVQWMPYECHEGCSIRMHSRAEHKALEGLSTRYPMEHCEPFAQFDQ